MRASWVQSADRARHLIAAGAHDRIAFRAALDAVAADARDAWLDRVLGITTTPDDGPELPRHCVPYLPCGVDAIIDVVDTAGIGPEDVVVDVGSGVGRAMAILHLVTGASAIGVEIQSALVRAAADVTGPVSPRIATLHGDAVDRASQLTTATVFFLYCPFTGDRLRRLLAALEPISRSRPIRIACVDLTLPPCTWLTREPGRSASVTLYRTRGPSPVVALQAEH